MAIVLINDKQRGVVLNKYKKDFWKRFLKLKFEAAESRHNQYRHDETSHDKGISLKDSGSRSCEKRAAECDAVRKAAFQ